VTHRSQSDTAHAALSADDLGTLVIDVRGGDRRNIERTASAALASGAANPTLAADNETVNHQIGRLKADGASLPASENRLIVRLIATFVDRARQDE
jgi:hypothetical protein